MNKSKLQVNNSYFGESQADSYWKEVWESIDSPSGERVSELSDETTLTAYVRYARYVDGEFYQKPLQPASQLIHNESKWVSPAVYFLNSDEEIRLREYYNSKTIQSSCEDAGRVAYAVLAESDALEKGYDWPTVADWLVEFAEARLCLSRGEYSLHFSGNRSFHLHTTSFLPGEGGREWLKREAKEFNQETGAELDTSIYSPKGQFRLSGAEHRKTGLYKVNVTPLLYENSPISREKVFPKSTSSSDEKACPFPVVPSLERRLIHYVVGDDDRSPLPNEFQSRVLNKYISEIPDTEGVGSVCSEEIYNTAFSPYAKVGEDNDRSVCLLKQTGELIESGGRHYVEAYVFQARGGDESFRRYNHDGWVMLSEKDARKWNFEEDDVIVIIGGRSRSSRLIELTDDDIAVDLVELYLNEDGKEDALNALQHLEYDIGESGLNGQYSASGSQSSSEAAALKHKVESGHIHHDNHDVLIKISCHNLRRGGWGEAWEWVKQVFGDDFDPEVTHGYLSTLVESYPASYSEVQIPEPP
jgi:hypothetical protein